ncbi:hypothetical protein BLNAU_17616 [Blattamonas nauphoetae]|uniref:Uncharacterized protein n=1 Tax=Blattamonas nauphoetae TaxID=2049346 RepID=A0ABQ9X6R0_9EUKA|nr:hypothetical protein BLNAU_17616 [Blattamonas nauphoetae]
MSMSYPYSSRVSDYQSYHQPQASTHQPAILAQPKSTTKPQAIKLSSLFTRFPQMPSASPQPTPQSQAATYSTLSDQQPQPNFTQAQLPRIIDAKPPPVLQQPTLITPPAHRIISQQTHNISNHQTVLVTAPSAPKITAPLMENPSQRTLPLSQFQHNIIPISPVPLVTPPQPVSQANSHAPRDRRGPVSGPVVSDAPLFTEAPQMVSMGQPTLVTQKGSSVPASRSPVRLNMNPSHLTAPQSTPPLFSTPPTLTIPPTLTTSTKQPRRRQNQHNRTNHHNPSQTRTAALTQISLSSTATPDLENSHPPPIIQTAVPMTTLQPTSATPLLDKLPDLHHIELNLDEKSIFPPTATLKLSSAHISQPTDSLGNPILQSADPENEMLNLGVDERNIINHQTIQGKPFPFKIELHPESEGQISVEQPSTSDGPVVVLTLANARPDTIEPAEISRFLDTLVERAILLSQDPDTTFDTPIQFTNVQSRQSPLPSSPLLQESPKPVTWTPADTYPQQIQSIALQQVDFERGGVILRTAEGPNAVVVQEPLLPILPFPASSDLQIDTQQTHVSSEIVLSTDSPQEEATDDPQNTDADQLPSTVLEPVPTTAPDLTPNPDSLAPAESVLILAQNSLELTTATEAAPTLDAIDPDQVSSTASPSLSPPAPYDSQLEEEGDAEQQEVEHPEDAAHRSSPPPRSPDVSCEAENEENQLIDAQ